jgi:hypothetical protein
MGNFLAVSAFRFQPVGTVSRAIVEYANRYSVSAETLPPIDSLDNRRDAQIYEPAEDWTVLLWPEYFNIHDFPLARAIAGAKGWMVSTVHVYDGDYWEHLCCSGESELHAFNSWPAYWKDDAGDDFDRILKYDSTPSRLAQSLGIAPSSIQPYLVDVASLSDFDTKAYPDDEYSLANFWVFTDFWRRLGIQYPDPPQRLGAILRIGEDFMDKLPVA